MISLYLAAENIVTQGWMGGRGEKGFCCTYSVLFAVLRIRMTLMRINPDLPFTLMQIRILPSFECGSGSYHSLFPRFRSSNAPKWPSKASTFSFWRGSGSGFHFDADLDPAFHFDADPDLASQNDADPDLQHWLFVWFTVPVTRLYGCTVFTVTKLLEDRFLLKYFSRSVLCLKKTSFCLNYFWWHLPIRGIFNGVNNMAWVIEITSDRASLV
jgi:hypothetical protein